MTKITLEQLPPEIRQALETISDKRVLITRDGLPFAVISTVGDKDEEDLELEDSPEFWRMIQERRHETTAVPLEDIMADLGAIPKAKSG